MLDPRDVPRPRVRPCGSCSYEHYFELSDDDVDECPKCGGEMYPIVTLVDAWRAPRVLSSTEQNVHDLVRAALARISFADCPFRTEVRLDREAGKIYTTMDIANPNLDIKDEEGGGVAGAVQFGDKLPPVLASVDHAIEWIYARVRDLWIHELNEVFFVDGKRRRDLHDEKGTIPAPEDAPRSELAEFKLQLAAFLTEARK